jgi:tetratricopeptide (TPR) repeat protein
MSSKTLRLSILGLGGLIFILLFIADRKALVTEDQTAAEKTDKSDQFFPSSLIALQPELAAAAEKLSQTRDSVQLQQVWGEIAQSSPDTLVQDWCRSQTALLNTDLSALVEQAEVLNQYRSLSDTSLQQAINSLELNLRSKAILMGASDADFVVERALLLVNTNGRSMEGILELRSLAEANPDNVKIQLILGEFSLQTGQWAKAEERFQKSLKLEPGNVRALIGMAESLSAQSKREEAKSFARKALESSETISVEKKEKLNRLLNS